MDTADNHNREARHTPELAALKAIDGLDVAAGLRNTAGNEKLYRKLLSKLADQHGGDAKLLRTALNHQDGERAHRIAHTLKGVAGTLGAHELQAAARATENAIREQDWPAARQQNQMLEHRLTALTTSLHHAMTPAAPRPAPAASTAPAARRNLPVILAVDDADSNIDTLTGLLGENYALEVAMDGRRALRQALECTPDLILLDILMPGMDGFETCRRLKEHDSLRDIPVIFISALEEVDEKIKAFQAGGVDYVTKPFQPDELKARVATHLTLRTLQKELEAQNDHLDQMVRQRTRELAAAHKRLTIADQAKNEFLQLISHELRTPTNGVLGIADLAFDAGVGNREIEELRPLFMESRERMMNVLDDALLLAQVHVSHQKYRAVPVQIDHILPKAIRTADKYAEEQGVRITMAPASTTLIEGDEALFEAAFISLLQTTLAFTARGERISVECTEAHDRITVSLQGCGKTLLPGEAEKFFNVFGSARNETHAELLGLKPAVAERIFSLFGGSVHISGSNPRGVKIIIRLPKHGTSLDSEHPAHEQAGAEKSRAS